MFYILIFFFIITIIYIAFCLKSLQKFNISKLNIKMDKQINEMFILGTHDSLSYKINNYYSQFAKTQNLNLDLQIKYGVRFFDLRFKIIDNMLKGYHAFIDLNINHIEIFNIFLSFLKQNIGEYLIISLKNEEFKDHNRISDFLYNNYIKPNNLDNYFVFNSQSWDYIPKYDEIKNKIFIINHSKTPIFNNLPWSDNAAFSNGSLFISDKYKLDVDEKLTEYNDFISKCSDKKINIFFSSMQFYNILGIKYINKRLFERLQINKKVNHIFVMDYVENSL